MYIATVHACMSLLLNFIACLENDNAFHKILLYMYNRLVMLHAIATHCKCLDVKIYIFSLKAI